MSEIWPPKKFELVNGPLDGAIVNRISEVMPQTIYVDPICHERQHIEISWSKIKMDRFTCKYVMDADKFKWVR